MPITACNSADGNGDGQIGSDGLTAAMHHGLAAACTG